MSHLNLEKFWLIWQDVSTDMEKLPLYIFSAHRMYMCSNNKRFKSKDGVSNYTAKWWLFNSFPCSLAIITQIRKTMAFHQTLSGKSYQFCSVNDILLSVNTLLFFSSQGQRELPQKQHGHRHSQVRTSWSWPRAHQSIERELHSFWKSHSLFPRRTSDQLWHQKKAHNFFRCLHQRSSTRSTYVKGRRLSRPWFSDSFSLLLWQQWSCN